MASAVFPNRNEHYFNERKTFMRKFPENLSNNTRFQFSPNPRPYPTTLRNPPADYNARRTQEPTSRIYNGPEHAPPVRPNPPPGPVEVESGSFYRKPEGGPSDPIVPFNLKRVTYNLSSYSRTELKELKRRLIDDLERVRSLATHIEAGAFNSKPPPSHLIPEFQCQFRPPSIDVSQKHSFEPPPPSKKRPSTQGNQQNRSGRKAKNQKASGQKRPAPYPLAGGPMKPASGAKPETEKVVGSMMRKCKQILTALMKHAHSWVFNKPVDVKGLGLHDYFQIISRPMDLGTVRTKLNNKAYRFPLDFAADVRLTFENALKYNLKGQDVHTMAGIMLSFFENKFQPAYQKFEVEYQKVAAAAEEAIAMPPPEAMRPILPTKTASSRELDATLPLEKQHSMVMVDSGNSWKPKPEDDNGNYRVLSAGEKSKLTDDLLILAAENMEQIVQIVYKRNPHLIDEGDELELDIEALDNETVLELDRFVDSLKKAGNMLKQVQFYDQLAKQGPKSPDVEPIVEPSLLKNKKWETGEEDVDIGEEIPANDFPRVEIEKDPAGATTGSSDSDSSSSSSDDSSSSDSESGSSSDSTSDEDSVQSPFVEPKRTPAD